CSYLVVTQEARLGLNGPLVIEQEAGVEEYDSRDRPFIWSLTGGEQRVACQLADRYVADEVSQIRSEVSALLQQGLPPVPRSQQSGYYLQRLKALDTTAPIDPATALGRDAVEANDVPPSLRVADGRLGEWP
uniref:Malonate decarboxylase subunit beta n=1 Tax=Steinernema glaseri TaxID=37863 RepID=A0A1I7XWZ5_9BILA